MHAWIESGAYELITPPPPNAGAPLSTLWHHAAACSGALFTAGTDAATGRQIVFGLDTADFTWTRNQDLPGDFFAPTIFCSGGLLLASGGASDASSSMVAGRWPSTSECAMASATSSTLGAPAWLLAGLVRGLPDRLADLLLSQT